MKTKYLIPAMLLLMLAGCYKEQTPVEEGSVPRKGTFNFSSSTGEVTKVLLNSDNTLFWAAGDKIAVYDYKAGSVYAKDIAVLTGGEGTAVGTFTPSTLPLNTSWYNAEDADNQQYNFYAYYPGGNSALDPEAGNVTVSVAASQEEAAGIGKYIVSWASANTSKQNLAGDSAPNFAFAPKSALLKLAIQNNTSHATNITQITITATGGNIAGNASLTLASGALTAGASNVITYTPASPIQIAPNSTLSVPVYVSVLPCAATNLAISCTESEGVYGAVNIAMSSIASGKVYSKTAVLTSFESQRFVIANPGDQSAKSDVLEANNLYYGTANSVLVPMEDESITVNIQLLKSADGYSRSAASASPFTSAVTSAKIIWTESGLSSDANFKITGGNLASLTLSKTAYTTGNALVGIYDADGRILWSYHIWVPADATVLSKGTGENEIGDHSSQYNYAFKLALGQIENALEPYMYYQWGRKDPLGRANSLATGNTLMSYSGDGPSESKKISALATGHSGNNLAYARQNPTVYIIENDALLYDWYPTTSGTTRTDANKPAGQNDNLWTDTTVGSIYDPCPEGYHVPGNNKLWYEATGKVYSSTDKAWTIYNLEYVLGGGRNRADGGVNQVSSNGYFWASEVAGGSSQYARRLHCSDSEIYTVSAIRRSCGFGVRCVKGDDSSIKREIAISNSNSGENLANSAALDAAYADDETDASSLYYGAANCVVMGASDTRALIDIRLKKSTDGYSRSGADPSPKVTAVKKAKVIWAEKGLYEDSNFCIASGSTTTLTVTKSAGVTGNALIGIYDESDQLLWSYHIWCPVDRSVVSATSEDASPFTYQAYKLALGQILGADCDTYMYYQWGRKDPLGRAESSFTGGGSLAATYGVAFSNKDHSSTGETVHNLGYARKNPTVFITDGKATPNDWYNPEDKTNQNDNLWKSDIATIFDPCPQGYHVAPKKLWAGNAAKVAGPLFESAGLWYVLGGYRHRESGGVYDVASFGLSWSSEVGSSSVKACSLGFGSGTGLYREGTNYRADGVGVRCVK